VRVASDRTAGRAHVHGVASLSSLSISSQWIRLSPRADGVPVMARKQGSSRAGHTQRASWRFIDDGDANPRSTALRENYFWKSFENPKIDRYF